MGIGDLPHELVLIIAKDFSIKDVYSLLRTCRGLASCLIPRLNELGLQDVGKLTALQWAVLHGHETLFDLAILAAGVDVNRTSRCQLESTALHLAAMSTKANLKFIRALVKHGASVDAKDALGGTPLIRATIAKRALVIEELLRLGADMGTDNDYTLAHIAARGGSVDCLRALADAGIDYSRVFDGQTILHEAFAYGAELGAVKYILGQEGGRMLVNVPDTAGCTPLHLLMKSRYLDTPEGREMVKLLLQCGADVQAKDASGNTPVHVSARVGDIDSMAELIRASYDIETGGASGETVLHVAVYGTTELMEYLLELGGGKSILEAPRDDGKTPVQLAVILGSAEKVGLLLRHGADSGVKGVEWDWWENEEALKVRALAITLTPGDVSQFRDLGMKFNDEDVPKHESEMAKFRQDENKIVLGLLRGPQLTT